MYSISTDTLTHIFSYLTIQEVARVSPVSSQWNEAQKTEYLWERSCSSVLDQPTPLHGSFKNRYIAINNLMNGIANVKKSPPSYKKPYADHCFNILEDNISVEIFEEPTNHLIYTIRDLKTGHNIHQIDFAQQGCDTKIKANCLYENLWTALTNKGEIFRFDIKTHKYLRCIQGDPITTDTQSVYLTSNKNEVIAHYDDTLKLWDAQSGNLVMSYDTRKIGYVYQIGSTSHYLILSAYNKNLNKCHIAIHKDSKSIQILEANSDHRYQYFACNDSYIAFRSSSSEIKIFQDSESSSPLNQIKTLEITPFPHSDAIGNIQIYRNWICVSGSDSIDIWDMRTWRKLSSIPSMDWMIEFRLNSNLIVSRIAQGNPLRKQNYLYTSYDFEHAVKKIKSSKYKKACSCM